MDSFNTFNVGLNDETHANICLTWHSNVRACLVETQSEKCLFSSESLSFFFFLNNQSTFV